jgi:hypothetical protein
MSWVREGMQRARDVVKNDEREPSRARRSEKMKDYCNWVADTTPDRERGSAVSRSVDQWRNNLASQIDGFTDREYSNEAANIDESIRRAKEERLLARPQDLERLDQGIKDLEAKKNKVMDQWRSYARR